MGDAQQFDAVVTQHGDVVIPSKSVRRLALVPGQHVHVTVTAVRRRENMYGALAGRLPDVSPEQIARVRSEVWGDLASGH